MLSFDIRSLESQAVVVDTQLSADDPIWEEGDPKPADSVHVTGRLSPAGAGRFYWHGRIEGDVALECSRCLTDTSAHVSDEAHIIFAESGNVEADDPDVYRLDPKERDLDLRPAIREEWVLAAPTFGLCRDNCKGLCAHCGKDLNEGSCDCEEKSADPRWDALRKLGGSSR
jgi:uncharacterized protein